MADAAATQPDAEQQPQHEALETITSEMPPELSATDVAAAEVAAEGVQAEPIAEVVDEKPPEAPPVSPAVLEKSIAPEPEQAIAPDRAPEPAIAPDPANVLTPQVASTTDVPASPVAVSSEENGGEWELLVEKVKQWIASGQLQQQWETARTPITLLAGLISVLVVLRIYSSLLGVLESLPLLPGLLELVGVISVVRFSLTRLVKNSDRQEVIDGLKQRWSNFRGNR